MENTFVTKINNLNFTFLPAKNLSLNTCEPSPIQLLGITVMPKASKHIICHVIGEDFSFGTK